MKNDQYYMKKALNLAKKAAKMGEIPVGVVIVEDNKIIAKAFNERDSKKIVTKHAEIIAIEKANRYKKNWRLNGCKMYVTLEPCIMCSSAIEQSRIDEVIYGANMRDQYSKNVISRMILNKNQIKNEEMIADCEKEIDHFFQNVRTKEHVSRET